MDNLRQIEDEIRSFANDVDKKYPEVLDASTKALHTLKSIRETYITSIRNKDSKLPTPNLAQSADLLAPFILLCNYSDASNRLVTAAINNISLQIQYNVVPYGEIKNIIRVLSIQMQSTKFDAHLKLLQLVVLLATFMIKGRNLDGSLSDHSTMLLLSLPLTLNDAKVPVSIKNAAYSTAKQVLSLILEEMMQQMEIPVWLTNSTILFFDEMVKLAVSSLNEIGNTSKSANAALSLALDCMFEICETFRQVRFPHEELQKRILKPLVPFVEVQLRDVRKIFDVEYQTHGLSSATAISGRIFRLSRWIVMVKLDDDVESLAHLFILLFHCIQPSYHETICLDRKLSVSNESDGKSNTKPDDPTNIFAKFALNLSISNVLSRGAFALTDTASAPKSSLHQNDSAYIEIFPRSYNCSTSMNPTAASSFESIKFLAVHPLVSSLEIFVMVARSVASMPPSAQSITLMSNVLVNCSTLLISSASIALLNGHSGEKEESHIITSLRKLIDIEFSNPFTGIDELCTLITGIHEHISTTILQPHDVVCMTILCIVLTMRNLLLWSYLPLGTKMFCNESNRYLALPSSAEAFIMSLVEQNLDLSWIDDLKRALDFSYEGIIDCATVLLRDGAPQIFNNSGIVLLHQICLALGAVNMCKQNEIAISVLCKQSLPIWHEKDLFRQDLGVITPSKGKPLGDCAMISQFDDRHGALFVCLLKLTHVMGNVISDWDCIVDCFDQIYTRSKLCESISNDVILAKASKELRFLAVLIDRFPLFTVSLCDDNLVKFMTSLVALSMNSLTSESRRVSALSNGTETFHGDIIDVIEKSGDSRVEMCPLYLFRGIQEKTITFSFKFAMETAKLNAFRIASIWQMIISHIRMMAAMKNPQTRTMAIVALFDVMLSSVKLHGLYHQTDKVMLSGLQCQNGTQYANSYVPVENIFKLEDLSRIDTQVRNNLKLEDLFSCLKSTATITFPDVRLNLLKGLKLLVQENGDLLGIGDRSGWKVLIEILSSIPYSCLSDVDQQKWLQSSQSSEGGEDFNYSSSSMHLDTGWPVSSLQEGFNCLKLIADEYLPHFLSDTQLVNILFECLSLYGSQSWDMNMALTAVELTWKVCDAAINSKHAKGTAEEILHLMLVRLFHLSMDQRPEVRNCAVNTFFSSTTAYASFVESDRYRYIFREMIGPWFKLSETKMAQESSTVTDPFTDKKSMKASLHHSRDSPLKQWSETRVLAIRGLLRLVRSCVKVVMLQSWFVDLWNEILNIGMGVVFSAVSTLEQSSSSIDLYFGMIYVTTESVVDGICSNGDIEQIERRKQELWSSCLSYLPSVCLCSTSFPDLTVSMCQKLTKLYTERKDAEFRYSENMKLLCWSISALSRPVYQPNSTIGFSNETQLTRAVVDLINLVQIRDGNRSVMETYISALLEIALAVQQQHVSSSKLTHSQILLPASQKLRTAVTDICLSSLLETSVERTKIGLNRRFFIGLLTKQFLESIGNQRIAFFSCSLRQQFQKQLSFLSDLRKVDRIVPLLDDNSNVVASKWYFFFPQYLSVLSLFCEALKTEYIQEALRSPESEIELAISLAVILSPWPASSTLATETFDAGSKSIAVTLKSFMNLFIENPLLSSNLKNLIQRVVVVSLLEGLVVLQMHPLKVNEIYVDMLSLQLSTFLDSASSILRSTPLTNDPLRNSRWYTAIIIIVRQLCNTVLANSRIVSLNDCLLSYLHQVLEFKALAGMVLLGGIDKRKCWEFSSRDSIYSQQSMEDLWLELLAMDNFLEDTTGSNSNQISPVPFLYDHLLDIVSTDIIEENVRKSSLEVLRSLNAMELVGSWKDSTIINEQLRRKCETLVQEVHQARSAAAFPF